MKSKKKKYIVLAIALSTIVLLLPVFEAALWFAYGVLEVTWTEIQIRRSSLYEPYAKDMAHLMSHAEFGQPDRIAADQIGFAWQPESLGNLPGRRFVMSAEHAVAIFGGGFYPIGYSLVLNKNESNDTETVWDLYIRHERRGPKIYTYRLPNDNDEYYKKLFTDAVNQYDKKIESEPDNEMLLEKKNNFLNLFSAPESP